MATITDPATELAILADSLLDSTNTKGGTYLAGKFDVEPWSTEFYKITSCIMERVDLVAGIVHKSDLDVRNKVAATNRFKAYKSAFAVESLINPWNNGPGGLLAMRDQGSSLGLLQGTIRPVISYPQLSSEEIDELIGLIDGYLEDLEESDVDLPFVRQAIRDGLLAFRFQLKYVKWMGSGYLLSSFRAVVDIHRHSSDYLGRLDNVDAGAVLKGMWTVIERFKGVVETVKPYTEAASYLWSAYSLAAAVLPMLPAPPLLLQGPQ